MKFARLLGGGRALASAASSLIDDEPAGGAAPKTAEPAADPAPVADPEPVTDPAPEADPAPQPEPVPDEAPPAAASEDAITAVRAEERQRVADVFASDACKGKERCAAALLGNPKLSASDIIGILPQMKGAEGGDAMLNALSQTPNPDLKPGAEASGGEKPGISTWDHIRGR